MIGWLFCFFSDFVSFGCLLLLCSLLLCLVLLELGRWFCVNSVVL